jgi:hypothetical protein
LQVRLQGIIYPKEVFPTSKLLLQPSSLHNSEATFTETRELDRNSSHKSGILHSEFGASEMLANHYKAVNIQQASSFAVSTLLKRARNPTRIIYSTAIAHALAARYQLPVTVVAAQIGDAVFSTSPAQPAHQEIVWESSSWSETQLQHVRVWVTATGLIQFEVGDRAIAAWLNHLARNPIQLQNGRVGQPFTTALASDPLLARRLFIVQHAHARCCSLLQLAHAAKLITLEQFHPQEPLTWQLLHPTPLPWLTPAGQLLLHTTTDRHLSGCLMAALDSLDSLSSAATPPVAGTVLKLAEAIGQAFAAFHAAHPLLEDSLPRQDNDIRTAYLGCLLVTQRILRLLLVDVLGVVAPLEL